MSIVLYGFTETEARRLAERYELTFCTSLDALAGNALYLQPELATEEEQHAFFRRMEACDDRIDAVIAAPGNALSTVCYCSPQGKIFTLHPDPESEEPEYELNRIVETQLGLINAHEC